MTIELEGLAPDEVAELIPISPVLVGYRGSHSHGTYIAPSDPNGADDIDIMTVYINPEPSAYFGVDGQTWTGRDKFIGHWDSVSYQLQHFAKLCATCNPNVISMLWLEPDSYIFKDWPGEALIKHRDLFSSKIAHKSFGGYAYSQLKRMTAWNKEQAAACGCTGEFHSDTCKEKEEKGRGSTKLYATGFMGEKRKGLVEKYGYDVKNAAHLIRLLRMGKEFLANGTLTVKRPDAAELVEIKTGQWSLERVQEAATALYADMDRALSISPLPPTPDFSRINSLVTEILCAFLNTPITMIGQGLWKKKFFVKEGDPMKGEPHVFDTIELDRKKERS